MTHPCSAIHLSVEVLATEGSSCDTGRLCETLSGTETLWIIFG